MQNDLVDLLKKDAYLLALSESAAIMATLSRGRKLFSPVFGLLPRVECRPEGAQNSLDLQKRLWRVILTSKFGEDLSVYGMSQDQFWRHAEVVSLGAEELWNLTASLRKIYHLHTGRLVARRGQADP